VRDRIRERARVDRNVDGVDRWGGGKLNAYTTLYDEVPDASPAFVDARLGILFASTDEGCVAAVFIEGMVWSSSSARWDLDYDGAWDTEFEAGATRDFLVDEDEPEIAIRVEYGSAGWRVGGDAITAIAPASCFEPPVHDEDSTGGDESTDDGDGETTDVEDDTSTGTPAQEAVGGGCGCATRAEPGPGPFAWLLIVAVGARRRRS
jgi:MYXO-CTERM domain-containing protein